VLAIDRSTIGLLASGFDLDKDGVVGVNRRSIKEWNPIDRLPPHLWTTDVDDTVAVLQLRVARALVARLAAHKNRMGLASLTFREWTRGTSVPRLTEKSPVLVPVGEPGAVLARLEEFPGIQEFRRTDLVRLFEDASRLLDEASSDSDVPRPRVIVLFSLGLPSAPDGLAWSPKAAVASARELAERGIAIWAIPFGNADVKFMQKLVGKSGGEVVPLDQLDIRFGAMAPTRIEVADRSENERTAGLGSDSHGPIPALLPIR
jgi:hypothetical protein